MKNSCENDKAENALNKDGRVFEGEPLVESRKSRLRPYQKPQLLCHGRLMEVTLGASGGAGESGLSTTHFDVLFP